MRILGHGRQRAALGSVLATILVVAVMSPPGDVAAAGPEGTIAYLSNDRRELRLIEPDGSGDRLLWRVEDPDALGIEDVAWSPDGSSLAIASGHESTCSIWHADLFRVDAGGGRPTRITNAPGCTERAGFPTGTVTLDLVNGLFDESIFVVYVQGAPGAQVVTLQPGFRGTVVFEEVADLGDGVIQYASVAVGSRRWLGTAFTDVVADTNVSAGELEIGSTAYDTFGALTVSWSRDASRLAYQLGQGVLWSIDAEPGLLAQGVALFDPDGLSVMATDPVWSPASDDVLFHRFDTSPFQLEAAPAGSALPGTALATLNQSRGYAWTPDGTAIVSADDGSFTDQWTNLYLLHIAEQRVDQLTFLPDGQRAWWPSVSPDGNLVVYTHITGDPSGSDASAELRILDLSTGDTVTLNDFGLQPSWGPAAVP